MHLVTRKIRTSKRTTQSQIKQPLLRRKRTKKVVALFAGAMSTGLSACLDRKFKQEDKAANMAVSEAEGGTSGYEKSLPIVLSVCHSPEWWIDTGANINVCAVASLFSFYQAGGTRALLIGNGPMRMFLVLVRSF